MKNLILLVSSIIIITGCSSAGYNGLHEFDWMPDEITWQNNIRTCRSQPACNAADLFNRHGI